MAGFGPSLAGLWATYRTNGRHGLRALAQRLRPRAAAMPYYLLSFLALAGLAAIAAWPWGPPLPTVASAVPLMAASLLRDTGPLGEEFGWRGFMLPALRQSQTPFQAALWVGVAWTLWHLPTFFIPSLPQAQVAFPAFAINTVALSLLMTWLAERTGGDLSLMIWTHWLANTALLVFAPPLWGMAAGTAALAMALSPALRTPRVAADGA